MHGLEQGATLSSTFERQLISMGELTMPHTIQFFMEAKLTCILDLPFILLTIPEVLM